MSDDQADTVDGAAVAASLTALLGRIRRNIELDLRVSAPARVIAFDPATCKATVRIEQLPILDVQGEEIPDVPILLPMIPVRFDRATLGGLTFPLTAGDTGRVVFSDRALAVWLQTGNPVAPVDPESGRTHDLGDAVFEPGVMTDADAIAAGPIDMTATVLDGAALVKVGALATEFALTGTTLAASALAIETTVLALGVAAGPDAAIINALKANLAALAHAIGIAPATKAMVE